MVKGDIQSVNITWNFTSLSDSKDTLPPNSQIILNRSVVNKTFHASSQLILTDVSVANAGVYYCSAVLIFKPVSGYESQKTPVEMYKRSIEIEKGEILANIFKCPHFDTP